VGDESTQPVSRSRQRRQITKCLLIGQVSIILQW
jgi:hypothetical protein